jgi:formate dehydrogenase subunit gamma
VPHPSSDGLSPSPDEYAGNEFSQRVRKVITETVATLRDPRGALLPILHGIQEEFTFVPPTAVAIVANELNLTRADVHGVVTFYEDFRDKKPGRHILRICQAESCQALGSRDLTLKAKAHLNVDFKETTPDGALTLEAVYCLGNCALSPAVQVDSDIYGRVTEVGLLSVIQQCQEDS